MLTRWHLNATVAAIVERAGDGGMREFLLVEEDTAEGRLLNNPAGHLEQGESPEQAVVRETLEETARAFLPEELVGVYLSRMRRASTGEDTTYLRFAFAGRVGEPIVGRALDTGILRTLWLSADAIRACRERHRSPLLLASLEDHLAGRRHPLDLIRTDPSVHGGG